MIKINNLNKYYNKGKRNEIHVINDTSLLLPDTGLITLFGPSGCGKTTLLNVIGGLDKASGDILVDNNKVNIEKYRRDNIGYIFQSYNLINDLTVYDNLRLALSVNNVEETQEVDKRIEYALKMVGMYKYRKKLASELSGGQQQRVSIARALTKKCKIIIADEPTGNLDSSNSIQIMNILKSLSKTKLVLLVTHSKELADYYSDTIISIQDGKVLNIVGSNKDAKLSKINDNKVYLKDLENTTLEKDNIKIDCYQEIKEDISLELVYVNGTYYLKSNVKIVPFNNQVELVDAKREDCPNEVNEEEFSYDDSHFSDTKSINIFTRIKNSFKEAFSKRTSIKRKKIFKLLFFVLGIVLVILNLSLARASFIETNNLLDAGDKVFLRDDSKYIGETGLTNNTSANEAYRMGLSEEYMPIASSTLEFNVYKGSYYTKKYTINALFTTGSDLAKGEIIYGNNEEALMSSKLANELMKEASISDYDTLFKYLNLADYASKTNTGYYKFSGIVEESTDIIYEPTFDYNTNGYFKVSTKNGLADSTINLYVYFNSSDTLNSDSLVCGRLPKDKKEIVVSSQFFKDFELTKDTNLDDYSLYSDKELNCKIVGVMDSIEYRIYTLNNDYRYILTNDSLDIYGSSISNISYKQLLSLIDDNEQVRDYANSNNLSTYSYYGYSYKQKKLERAPLIQSNLQQVLVCALILVIYIFFIMRTQIIKDIYEIGVLRALGIPRVRIYLNYVCQIIVTMFQSVLVSYILLTAVVGAIELKIASYTKSTFNLFLSPSTYYVFFILLLSSIIIGLIPVFLLVRKKPAQILAKYDM